MSPNKDSEVQGVTVKVPRKFEFNWSSATGILLIVGSLGITSFWLYADRHNDERYVPKPEFSSFMIQYKQDQQTTLKTLDEIKKDQDKLIDHILAKEKKP